MLVELGSIIDRIYGSLHSGRAARKRLIFIVGGGIRQVTNILNDRAVQVEAAKRGYKPGTIAYENFRWRLFEYARYYTANGLPTYAHCCIYKMVETGACSHVITTNYDLYFDAIWRKHPGLKVATNPVAKRNEYLWDGYYSYQANPTRQKSYWKIHGSLSHGVFPSKTATTRNEYLLVLLPRMAIPSNQPDIAKAYGLSTTSPFLGFEATKFRGTTFPHGSNLKSKFRPFIDWTYGNDRSVFNREIAAAISALRDTTRIEAIILLGFRGYYNRSKLKDPRNEELIPILESLKRRGFKNIFMAVDSSQYATASHSCSWFLRDLLKQNKAVSYSEVGDLFRELVSKHSKRFPYNLVDAEYAKWANYYYSTDAEAAHA